MRFPGALIVGLSFLIMARVVASWVDPDRRRPSTVWLSRVTEPILAPVRRRLPATGPLDFSPMVVAIVLALILAAMRA